MNVFLLPGDMPVGSLGALLAGLRQEVPEIHFTLPGETVRQLAEWLFDDEASALPDGSAVSPPGDVELVLLAGELREQDQYWRRALAAGLPVASAPNCGTERLLGDAWVPLRTSSDPAEVAAVLRDLGSDSLARERLSRRARARARRLERRLGPLSPVEVAPSISPPEEPQPAVTPHSPSRVGQGSRSPVLLIRGGGLGDLLMLTPALGALRRLQPDREIVLACLRQYCRLFDGLGLVDRTLPMDAHEDEPDRSPFAEVYDLRWTLERHERAEQWHRVPLWGKILGVEVHPEYVHCRYRVSSQEREWAVRVLAPVCEGRRGLIGVQVRSMSPVRWYPYWRELVESLASAGWAVAYFWDTVAEGPQGPGIAAFTGRLSLREVAAAMEQCDAFFAPDSGLYHLAGALGVPVLGIFNEVSPELRRPLSNSVSVNWFEPERCPFGKMPCGQAAHELCLSAPCLRYEVEPIVAQLEGLAAQRSAPPSLRPRPAERRPRLLLVTTVEELSEVRGGTEGQIIRLAAEARRRGWSVDVRTAGETLPAADLVHLIRAEADPAASWVGEAIRELHVPVLVTPVHWPGDAVAGYRAQIGLCSFDAAEKYAAELRAWVQYWCGLGTLIVCGSWAEAGLIEGVMRRDPRPVRVVPRAIDCRWITPVPSPWSQDGYLLQLGRIEPRKNQLHLLRALDHHPGRTLRIAGWEADLAYADLVRRQISPQTRLEGIATREALHGLFAGASVVCQPSWWELPGLAALEGLASGRPIVVGNRAAERETFGALAHYCDPADPLSIAQAIDAALAAGPPPGEKVAELLRERSWEAVAMKTTDLYEERLRLAR